MSSASSDVDRISWKSVTLKLLIFIDCVVNFITNGSINETLSSRAQRMRSRKQPAWGWTADVIDWWAYAIFGQKDHCRKAFEFEQKNGGALMWMPRWLFVEIF